AIRIAAGQADLILGCDAITAGSQKVLGTIAGERTTSVLNVAEMYPGSFTKDADFSLPTRRIVRKYEAELGTGNAFSVDATGMATTLLGDAIAANLFMLGYAWQKGTIPLSEAALMRAIELNGVAVDMNKAAFRWGRKAAHDGEAVAKQATPKDAALPWRQKSLTLDETIQRRVEFLTSYQSSRYAKRYESFVRDMHKAEERHAPGKTEFTDAVAKYLFKLMAIKDEYEVARLYTDGGFQKQLERQFAGDYRLEFHLAPPIMAKRDPETGHLKKKTYGPGMMRTFAMLAKLRGLRGTPLDIFGYSVERKMERALIKEYRTLMARVAKDMNADTHAIAVGLAAIPEKIRGYGHVRERHIESARADQAALLEAFENGGFRPAEAAE
ncbi:MAG: DUF6537 domain-containing protein, partial [Pseudomonadota bacterium]